MDTPEREAQRIFGRRAVRYTTSACHTDPQVLARVVELASPKRDWHALDVGTGTGHTAFALAPHVASVLGLDLTPQMLAEARKLQGERAIHNVSYVIADAHRLPLPDGAFDLVTCRRAAHHFSDILGALREIGRVLRPGGGLVIDDRSVPEDDLVDDCMNALDRLHDGSHVRQYRPREWQEMLAEAGFEVEVVEPYVKHRPLSSLTAGVSAGNVRRIRQILAGLHQGQRKALNVAEVHGQLHINHWYVMVSARLTPAGESSMVPPDKAGGH